MAQTDGTDRWLTCVGRKGEEGAVYLNTSFCLGGVLGSLALLALLGLLGLLGLPG